MKKFEHLVSTKTYHELSETVWLNQMGNDGWELVSVVQDSTHGPAMWHGTTYYFKREVRESTASVNQLDIEKVSSYAQQMVS